MYVNERFELDDYTIDTLRDMEPPFGYNGFGEFLFYRTYSRSDNGFQENWFDCVVRVINGIMSIRKDFYIKNHIHWNQKYWKNYSRDLAISMFKMQWSPPGRGLFHCGTDFTYQRGSMALYNCSFTNLTDNLGDDIAWLMDCLMLGVGVGFAPLRNDDFKFKNPKGIYEYVIPDSREGWCDSEKQLIDAYIYGSSKPRFNYSEIREKDLPIKGFGGLSSGPEPLIEYHKQTEYAIEKYMTDKYYDSVIFKTDLSNQAGCAISAGNIRRSAELAQLDIDDSTFKNLKNYDIYPEREVWGWMSNNTVNLKKRKDFERLGEIAERVIIRGEPGVKNVKNLSKGRIGKKDKVRKDKGKDFNPCITGETKICLANGQGFVAIKDILDKDVDVYCINERDEVCIRRMRNPRITGYKQPILKIIFDNGDSIRVTPNHKFMLRDRSFKEAKDLLNGDSLAVMRRYTPENCEGNSYWDKYISISFAASTIGEHRLIAENKFGYIDDTDHVHHKDLNKLNNNPSNIELKDCIDHLSDHTIEEWNPNWSGYTSKDLIDFGVKLAIKLGRRFSTNEWNELKLIQSFSEYRKKELGSFEEFAFMCADLAEVINHKLDTRTLRHYLEMIDQGYETEIIDNKVYIIKICEGCKKEFKIESRLREHACCSLSCNNTIRDYSKNIEGQRKTFAIKRETLKEAQLEIYCKLKNILKRVPKKEEWIQGCKDANISVEICRIGSPFKSWKDLKWKAKDFNHRVAYVIQDGEEDVYNGTVDEFHNFIIGGWNHLTPFGRRVYVGIVNMQCGEIILEHREVCNVDETLPTICENVEEWYAACKYATFYASTVSLLPTHQQSTNAVVARNRRIGVSIVDYTGWIENENVSIVTKYLKKGYKIVRKTNQLLATEAGVPESIRVTTIKPGGTIPKLVGKTSGAGYPNFHYMLRRVRVQRNHPITILLKQAGIPFEADYFSKNTDIFEFPIECGPASPVDEISLWQQSMNLVLLQREWADNSVSNTLMFRPKWKLIKSFSIFEGSKDPMKEAKKWINKHSDQIDHEFFNDAFYQLSSNIENDNYKVNMRFDDDLDTIEIKLFEYDPRHEENQIEAVLAAIMPLIKSVSLLPHSPKGAYKQQPEEKISKEEYDKRVASIRPIDWSQLSGSQGIDEKFCSSELCEI